MGVKSAEWFAANLHRVREPSLRHYVRARELKAAGMDWTEVLAAEAENPRARLAAELLGSNAYSSTAARARAFVEQGGGCRATFFNYRRNLAAGTGRPKNPVRITPARKFRMLLHTNPTRERGECLGTRAGASEDL